MRIKFTDDFISGHLKVICLLPISRRLRFNRNLLRAIRSFERGCIKPPNYTINSIKGERNWYNCYIYGDTQYVIILQYIVEDEYVILLRIGPIEDFVDLNLEEWKN